MSADPTIPDTPWAWHGLSRSTWAWSTALGVALGVGFTLSPTTVLLLACTPSLFLWAGRGLGPRERRWVLGTLTVALLARLVALGVFFTLTDHQEVPFGILVGDERLIKWRSLWMLHLALGDGLAPLYYESVFSGYGRSGLHDALAYWQLWFGHAPYGLHLWNVMLWLTGAVAIHRTARLAFGVVPALGGFVLVLFMPTLFVWSISGLKEPAYFLLTAITLAAATAALKGPGLWRRIFAAVIVMVAVYGIGTLRSAAFFVAAGGVAAGVAGWLVTRRAWLCVGVAMAGLAVGTWAFRQPAVQTAAHEQIRVAAVYHMGNVLTTGYSYRLLDAKFYDPDYAQKHGLEHITPDESARFVLRALASVVVVPAPWRAASPTALALLPQQTLWYLVVIASVVGVAAGLRRDAAFTAMLLGNIALGTATVALFNGNVGTLVRMRDSVVTLFVWFGALGAVVILEQSMTLFRRRPQHDHSR